MTGNENLATMTSEKDYEMRVRLWDWDGATRHANYDMFEVGPASDKYRLTIGGFDSDAADNPGGC